MSQQPQVPVRSVIERIVTSGLLRAVGLDAVGFVALVCIGVTVYRLSHDAIWAYAGVLLLGIWWTVGQARATAQNPKANG